jgi:small GTP-binding protein
MPMPHEIQLQVIKKRLKGKEGKAKLREISAIMQELPGLNTGPYAKIKRWLTEETAKTKVKSKIKHQDWAGIKRQGVRQFALVGCPSAGKSSLIRKLSGLQTKVASYEFTTLKPLPAIVHIKGADFQIVDLPGLLEGAVDDVGGGKRLIAIVKSADGVILMHDLSKPIEDTEKIVRELNRAAINKPMIVIGSKIDLLATRESLCTLEQRFKDSVVIGLSIITGEGITKLKEELWAISGLIRAYTDGQSKPFILEAGSTVADLVSKIHSDLAKQFRFARVTGKSTKYPKQQVGSGHVLLDGDVVELVLAR